MLLAKETFDAAVDDRQLRSGLLRDLLSGEAEVILKSSYRCDPPTGQSVEEKTEFFNEKGVVLWSVDLKPPEPIYGHGPQVSCKSDCQQIVLFESGELVMIRTRRYSGSNKVYNYGVGEYIDETEVDVTPLTEAEFENHRARIGEELWRRACAIEGRENG